MANEGALTVALDIDVTPELFLEGLAREIINRVQNLRKSRDFDITDHITMQFIDCPEVREVTVKYGDYIAAQVLADAITIGDPADENAVEILDIDGLMLGVVVEKA